MVSGDSGSNRGGSIRGPAAPAGAATPCRGSFMVTSRSAAIQRSASSERMLRPSCALLNRVAEIASHGRNCVVRPSYALITYALITEGHRKGDLAACCARQMGSDTCSARRTIGNHLDPTTLLPRSRITAAPFGWPLPGALVVDRPRNSKQTRDFRLTLSVVLPTTNRCIAHPPPSSGPAQLNTACDGTHPAPGSLTQL